MSRLAKESGHGQAVLPEELTDRSRLADLSAGERTWCVPWAMEVDEQGRCWLNLDAAGDSEPGGTVSMLVQRGDNGWSEWRVTVPRGYRWRPSRVDPARLAPVAELLIGR